MPMVSVVGEANSWLRVDERHGEVVVDLLWVLVLLQIATLGHQIFRKR